MGDNNPDSVGHLASPTVALALEKDDVSVLHHIVAASLVVFACSLSDIFINQISNISFLRIYIFHLFMSEKGFNLFLRLLLDSQKRLM